MDSKQSSTLHSTARSSSEDIQDERLSDSPPDRYVIQRSSETYRDWWNGNEWSRNADDAQQFDSEPDAGAITKDESAVAIRVGEVDD